MTLLRTADRFVLPIRCTAYPPGVINVPVILAYFLRQSTATLEPPENLDTTNLLFPSRLIEDSCWRQGFFVTRGNRTLAAHEIVDASPFGPKGSVSSSRIC